MLIKMKFLAPEMLTFNIWAFLEQQHGGKFLTTNPKITL